MALPELLFQVCQAVGRLRYDHHHRQFLALIRHLQHGEALRVGIQQILLRARSNVARRVEKGPIALESGVAGRAEFVLVHHRHAALRATCQPKDFILGLVRLERLGPLALEVDRVGQDQPRGIINAVLGDQVLDPIASLLFHPGVDLLAGPLGIAVEVHGKQSAGAVELVERVHVRLLKGKRLLAPEGIGHAQFVLIHLGEQLVQFVGNRLRLSGRGFAFQPIVAGIGGLIGRLESLRRPSIFSRTDFATGFRALKRSFRAAMPV